MHSPVTGWSVLAISILLTVLGWRLSDESVRRRSAERFSYMVKETEHAIHNRMIDYEQVLHGGAGLFKASEAVSRRGWRAYFESLELHKFDPGIQVFGFSLWVPPLQKSNLIHSIRAEGFPQFEITPAGERAEHTAIIYLEPFEGRNLRAFGYDMWSERVRHEALTRARDTAQAALTGRVTLVQETDKQVQPGVLMFYPVYRENLPTTTVAERQAALHGFVYSAFRMHDLMEGIVGQAGTELAFELFDGREETPGALLFSSGGGHSALPADYQPSFSSTSTLNIAGQTWALRFRTLPGFDKANASTQPLLVGCGGLLVNLLLFFIVSRLSDLRKEAVALAEKMTGQLTRANDGLQQEVAERRRFEAERERIHAAMAATNLEMEQFNKLAVGRELRMIELKREINELASVCGYEARYDISFAESDASRKKAA